MAPAATTGPGRPRTLLTALLLCTAVLAVGYRGLTLEGGVLVGGDVAQMHVPVRSFVQAEVAAGRPLPLWFGGDGLGVPLLGAAVPALLHPPSYLGWPLGAARSFWLASLLMVVLAFFGTRALARELEASEPAALLAAGAYVLGGPFISNLQNYQFFSGLAALPLLLYGGLRFAARPGPGAALAAVGATFSMVTAGSFQAAYLGWAGGLLLVLGLGASRRRLARWVLLFALSVAAGAVQLFPSIVTFANAGRLGGLPWEMASRWSLHPRTLVDLGLGDLLHFEPAHQPGLAPLYDLTRRTPWIAVAYVGVLVLVLAGFGLASPTLSRRLRAGLGLGVGLLLLAALGKHTPLYGWLHAGLPLWDGFRYPAKLLPYAALLLALLSGLGLDRLRERPGRNLAIGGGAAILLMLVLGLVLGSASDAWTERLGSGLLRAAALLAAGAGILYLVRRRPGLAAPALLGLALLELSAVSHHAVWLYAGEAPPVVAGSGFAGRIFETARPLETGAPRPPPRVFTALSMQKGLPVKGHALNALTLSSFERLALKPDFAAEQGLEAAAPYLPGTDARLTDLLLSVPADEATRRAAFLGAGFLVTDPQLARGLDLSRDRVLAFSRKAELLLFELPEPWVRPRVRLCQAAAAPPLDTLPALRAALDAEPVRSGAVALVELEDEALPATVSTLPDPRHPRVLRWDPETLEIALEGEAPKGLGARLLLLNEGWAPGWSATVDGAPAEVLRANGVLRAVRVEPGTRRVRLDYSPPGLVAGGVISAAAWLLLLAWSALPWLRKSHRIVDPPRDPS